MLEDAVVPRLGFMRVVVVVAVRAVLVAVIVVVGAIPVHRRLKFPRPATPPPLVTHSCSVMHTPPSSSRPSSHT